MKICNCGAEMLLISTGDGVYWSCHNCGNFILVK